MKRFLVPLLLVSHLIIGAAGFALGIYLLPILIAPDAPSEEQLRASSVNAIYTAQFKRNLAGSDALHWGEGIVSLSNSTISFKGRLAPGPDYKLYLSPDFVETEAQFNTLKNRMKRIADIKTFDGFIVDVPDEVPIDNYTTVVVWCETFGEFISAGQYR